MWHVLEGDVELVLANATQVRNVPGRKSDVNDATWRADLLAHGLIRPSFVPPRTTQEVRGLTRTRTQLVREASRHLQRIEKVLEDANLKLSSVLSEVGGVGGARCSAHWSRAKPTPNGSPIRSPRASRRRAGRGPAGQGDGVPSL